MSEAKTEAMEKDYQLAPKLFWQPVRRLIRHWHDATPCHCHCAVHTRGGGCGEVGGVFTQHQSPSTGMVNCSTWSPKKVAFFKIKNSWEEWHRKFSNRQPWTRSRKESSREQGSVPNQPTCVCRHGRGWIVGQPVEYGVEGPLQRVTEGQTPPGLPLATDPVHRFGGLMILSYLFLPFSHIFHWPLALARTIRSWEWRDSCAGGWGSRSNTQLPALTYGHLGRHQKDKLANKMSWNELRA